MPHSHSAHAAALRRQRAIDRGYVVPRPAGTRHLLVDDRIAPDVRTVAKAMATHARLDADADRPHHHLRSAALAAKDRVSEATLHDILRLNRDAGRAKHNVSRKRRTLPSPPPSGGAPLAPALGREASLAALDVALRASSSALVSFLESDQSPCVAAPGSAASGDLVARLGALEERLARFEASSTLSTEGGFPALLSRLDAFERKVDSLSNFETLIPQLITPVLFKDVSAAISRQVTECIDSVRTSLADDIRGLQAQVRSLGGLQGQIHSLEARLQAQVSSPDESMPRPDARQDEATATTPRTEPRPPATTPPSLIGSTVRITGLRSATQWNDRFGLVQSIDAKTGRFILRVDSHQEPLRVLPHNVEYPATCPRCMCEVTSSACFDCGFGQ